MLSQNFRNTFVLSVIANDVRFKPFSFQEADFFRITMQPQWEKNGLMIICRSMQMSKFKLVLFDKEGGVRIIQVASVRFQFSVLVIGPFQRFIHVLILYCVPL